MTCLVENILYNRYPSTVTNVVTEVQQQAKFFASTSVMCGRIQSLDWNSGMKRWNGTVEWNGGMEWPFKNLT